MTTRQEFFNQAADNWNKQFQTRDLIAFLRQLVPKFGLETGQNVLDVGAGTGVIVPFLLEAVGPNGRVVAVDFAEKMAEKCRAKYGNLTNFAVSVQQVEKLDFPSENFGAAVCFGVFPHLTDKEEALRQINRVLKPKGKLIIAHSLSSEEIEAHHHRFDSIIAHDVLPDRASMKRKLRNMGFTQIHIIDKPGCYLCTAGKRSNE
jgi:ubiquinone/menaquinone biosynthesis C-methylase UbiE